jgi:hypothetical protein
VGGAHEGDEIDAKVVLPQTLSSLTEDDLRPMRLAKAEMWTGSSLSNPFLAAVSAAVSMSKL